MQKENKTFLSDWLINEITDKELQELVSKEDYMAYKKIKIALNQVEKPSFGNSKTYNQFKEKLPEKQAMGRELLPNWIYMVAATLILFFGVYHFFQADLNIQTSFGENQEIALNDGTRIQLNAQSSLNYPKYRLQREVKLNGEAFFEVTKKGNFTVVTENGIIHVLGTKFNVISRKDYLEVVCYEGKVKIIHKADETILQDGEAWRMIEDEKMTWETPLKKATWLQGESSFKSVPLSYVIEALESQYNVELVTNSIDDSVQFTGSFTHDDIKSALQSICLPLGIKYKFEKNRKLIVLE